MKRVLITLGFLMCCFLTTYAQHNRIKVDFDKDGKIDVLELQERDNALFIVFRLSTLGLKPIMSKGIEFYGMQSSITTNSKGQAVVTFGFNRAEQVFKFRYEPKSKIVRLIGFDYESFGNAMHDGSGFISVNVITGDYNTHLNTFNESKRKMEHKSYKGKLKLPVYRLQDFNDNLIKKFINL